MKEDFDNLDESPKDKKLYCLNEIFKPISEEKFSQIVKTLFNAYRFLDKEDNPISNSIVVQELKENKEIRIEVDYDFCEFSVTFYCQEGEYMPTYQSGMTVKDKMTWSDMRSFLWYEYCDYLKG